MPQMPPLTSPGQALLQTRLIWLILILGQIAFGVVVLFLNGQRNTPANADLYPVLLYVSIGVFVSSVMMGYFLRNQIYKANWQEHAITPKGYFTGNLLLMAMLEGAAILPMATILITGNVLPTGAVALAALAVQAVNFPTGGPMQPSQPVFPPSASGNPGGRS